MPTEDIGILQATVSAPEGTGYEAMDRIMLEVSKPVLGLLEKGTVRSVIQRTPGAFSASDDFNNGIFVIFLKPWEERSETTDDVIKQLNKIIGAQTTVRGNATARSSIGRGRGQPINFVLAGGSYADLALARDRILAAARDNPGIVNLDADYKETKPQILIDVDTARAGDLGVSLSETPRSPARAVSTSIRICGLVSL